MRAGIKKFIQGDLLLGRWLVSNIRLVLLVVVLILLYITNRYKIEGTVKSINACSKEIEQLHQRHTKIKTTYQNSSMMLVLAKKLEPIGIGVSKEPIKEVIFISDKKEENE